MSTLRGPELPAPRYGTLLEALRHASRPDARVTFVTADEQETTLTWPELRDRAERVAASLRSLGVAPGDRVAIVVPTSPAFVDAFFGALCAGAVPVPLYPPVRLGRLDEYHRSTARMIETSGSRLVLADRRVRLLLGEAIARARPVLGCRDVSELLGAERHPGSPAAPDDLALIQFSSGSTVDPKPVALTHRQILAQLATLEAMMPRPPAELGVSWLPLYHDMGLIGALLSSVYYPGPLVLIPPEHFLARPALWLRAISRHRATISPAPNFAYALCLKRVKDEELAGVDLSSWLFAPNGAEPVSAEVLRRFAGRFGRYGFQAESLLPVYGLSEASLAVTWPPPGRRVPKTLGVDSLYLAARGLFRPGARELTSVGVPVPGAAVEVRDRHGPVPAGKVGRVFVSGPSVMSGYFQRPEATAATLVNGWLDTGDLGFVHDGELYVCGRAKEVVILRGANHTPQEFEECLDGIAGLRAGCAVALGFVPEGSEGEELLILAERGVPERADAEVEQDIRKAIVERTSLKPHTVRLLAPGTLPRTSSGKLRRAEALRRFLAGELSAPEPVGALRMAAAVARSAFGYVRAELRRK